MLVYPFDGALHVSYLIGVALVYFGFYARDLAALGYRGGDFFRVYAINLLLIPINIAGVCKSLQQILTKKKIPFGRTPKVQGRTAAPPLFIVFELVLMVYLLVGALVDVGHGRYVHMVFSAVNGLFFWYAWTYFIGWRHAYEDVRAGVRSLRAPAE
jgi:cellulose synthase (UDP-forming)